MPTMTFQQIRNKINNPNIGKEELSDIAHNFPTAEKESDQLLLLRGLLLGDHCNDLLSILIEVPEVPIEKLDGYLLDGIARVEINEMELFLTALKRLKGNKDFILGIKNNDLYSSFIENYEKAVSEFNEPLILHIKLLDKAENLKDISNIREKIVEQEEEIENKRKELLKQYPEEALSEELMPEKILLTIDSFIEAAELAKKRVNASEKLKEQEKKYDELRTASNQPKREEITFAWKLLKEAHRDLNQLLFNSYEKEYSQQQKVRNML